MRFEGETVELTFLGGVRLPVGRVVPLTGRGRSVVRVEGDAAWDGEHGVVLHFEDGDRLMSVSGYGVWI